MITEAQKRYNKEYYNKNKGILLLKQSEYNNRNREKIRNYKRRWQKKNGLGIKARKRQYYLAHKDKILEGTRAWKKANRNRYLQLMRNYQNKNKKKIAAQHREYYQSHRERLEKYKADWRKLNSERVRGYRLKTRLRYETKAWYREYQRQRSNTDPSFKLRMRLACRIRHAIKNNSKSTSTISLLGANIGFVRDYLESKFTGKMTWKNYGSYWHVDHIIPCAAFDLSKPEEQRRCFHYTNLQPLEAKANLSKGDNIL